MRCAIENYYADVSNKFDYIHHLNESKIDLTIEQYVFILNSMRHLQ